MISSLLLDSHNKRASTVSSTRRCRARTEQFLSVIDHLATNPSVLTPHKIILLSAAMCFPFLYCTKEIFAAAAKLHHWAVMRNFSMQKWKFKKNQNSSLFPFCVSLSSTCDTQISTRDSSRKQCFE